MGRRERRNLLGSLYCTLQVSLIELHYLLPWKNNKESLGEKHISNSVVKQFDVVVAVSHRPMRR